MLKGKGGLEEESAWILPENLQEEQQKVLQKTDLDGFDTRHDFESYKLLLHGRKNTGIETHNLMRGTHVEVYVKTLKKILKRFNHSIGESTVIGDMGCGAGFIAAEIKKQLPPSRIFAYDISVDAITCAKDKFKDINFISLTIKPQMVFTEAFDIIHTREFYPFTRTNSVNYEMLYIDTFLNNLNKDGLLIIGAAHTDKCILNNLSEIKKAAADKADLYTFLCPSTMIYRLCPILPLAQLLTAIAYMLSGTRKYYILVFRKK